MHYNHLGRCGLKISQLSLGSWLTFGETLDVKAASELVKYAFEHGINFFDNAEVYAKGQSEVVMGQAIKNFRREELIISTKIFWSGDKPNDIGLSRKHLIEATKNSLKRLQLDYVDLLYCHRPDPETPIAETVRAMDHLVREGHAFYWGTSEWGAAEIEEAYQLAEKMNCVPPTMEQPQYNLFHRKRVEQEYLSLYEKYGLGTTTWAPLAYGLLTGKYNDGIPPNSRLALAPQWCSDDMAQRIAIVRKLVPIAKALGCSLAQLALAWCSKNPHVSSVIVGASTLEQLKENLGALEIVKQLDETVIKEIEVITELEETN